MVGDSADRATWIARRDAAAARVASATTPSAPDLLDAANASRNVALAATEPAERSVELTRAERGSRAALEIAPDDPLARFTLARTLLDALRAGARGDAVLAEVRALLAPVLAADRRFAGGAALESLAEAYGLAGAGRADAPELERAAALFDAALDVSPQSPIANWGYAELVLMPCRDYPAAISHLRVCTNATLDPDPARLADQDRAQRRCTQLITSLDPPGAAAR